MADFNGEAERRPRRKLSKSMAKLSDDLVLEIVARLPLKKAVQCATLNKNFCRCISGPTFARLTASISPAMILHCSGRNPKIYTKLCQETKSSAAAIIPLRSGRDSVESVTLDQPASVMASCNGLLLHFGPTYIYYVINPITAAIMFVDYPVNGRLGLAVDFSGDDAHFKLVSLRMNRTLHNVLMFTVLVPDDGNSGRSMKLKSRLRISASGAPEKVDKIQPVYAYGSLYWLGDGATTTVAFDVEKEQALIILGPVPACEDDLTGDKWFGFADDSIQLVYAQAEEIVICRLDQHRREWSIKQRIPTLSNPSNNDYGKFGYGEPVFYGGGCLHFMVRRRGENGHVYVYDLKKGEWELRWSVAGWTDAEQHFFQYTPSIAKVSTYNIWNSVLFTNSFHQFRKLMLPKEF